MDKRQQKTRDGIFRAFSSLLKKKSYSTITVQDIIDEANIGRSTFYSHFETKDDLADTICRELFDHIIDTAMDNQTTHGLYSCTNAPNSVVLHILQHLLENDHDILTLLSCESNDLFLQQFKLRMNHLVRVQYLADPQRSSNLPDDFLINHISGSFVEMVRWWLSGHRQLTPEELDSYFRAVTEPIL